MITTAMMVMMIINQTITIMIIYGITDEKMKINKYT